MFRKTAKETRNSGTNEIFKYLSIVVKAKYSELQSFLFSDQSFLNPTEFNYNSLK